MINTNDFDYDDGVTVLEEWINCSHVSLILLYLYSYLSRFKNGTGIVTWLLIVYITFYSHSVINSFDL